MTVSRFSYEEAFSRNLGWVTEWEQQALRHKRVAIAGLGGVGGAHLLTLARLGIGAFRIADLDRFELPNMNRQAGASLDTLGRPKVDVLCEMARRINPEIEIEAFSDGVNERNLDHFLDDVDLFVDGLDFFVLDVRRAVFARCGERGIAALTAAPLGMGAAYLVFIPGGMTFDEYFRLEGLTTEHQYVNFLVGLAPRPLHLSYLVDPSRVDLAGQRGPSTAAACQVCAGVVAAEAVKLLLRRGPVRAVPYYHHFDAYRGRWVVGRLSGGNRHPLQRLKLRIARKKFAEMSRRSVLPYEAAPNTDLERILDAARWAPSGDNNQPWRFELTGPQSFRVHLRDSADHDIYDYRDGEPSLLSGGMLLENVRIAASAQSRTMEWHHEGSEGHEHRIAVSLEHSPSVPPDPLTPFIWTRSVDRRPFQFGGLNADQRGALAAALGGSLQVGWHESLGERLQAARLGSIATGIRLTIPETYAIHREVVDWTRRHSPTGIPSGALGLDRLTLGVMRWAMVDRKRFALVNRVLGGRFLAALQMDYLPAICSGAFFTLAGNGTPPNAGERGTYLLSAGQAIQRFWLTAARLGLAIQPALATLIFTQKGLEDAQFTENRGARRQAAVLARRFQALFPSAPVDRMLFLGRIGVPWSAVPIARSTRRPLSELIVQQLNPNSSRDEL
jgi:sulfur-carrier protein adenylyltransferase/sulfurtransferase